MRLFELPVCKAQVWEAAVCRRQRHACTAVLKVAVCQVRDPEGVQWLFSIMTQQADCVVEPSAARSLWAWTGQSNDEKSGLWNCSLQLFDARPSPNAGNYAKQIMHSEGWQQGIPPAAMMTFPSRGMGTSFCCALMSSSSCRPSHSPL